MIRSSFSIIGDPIGKPTWQKSDKWLSGDDVRPCVQKYRDWCDQARLCATGDKDKQIDAQFVYNMFIFSHIRMAKSWSQKKRDALAGSIHQAKPDSDNITKAVKDALFGEDKYVSGEGVQKFWCYDDEEPRIDIYLIILADAKAIDKEEADCLSEGSEPSVE